MEVNSGQIVLFAITSVSLYRVFVIARLHCIYFWGPSQREYTLVATDIEPDEAAQELLKEIVSLWVTIRGFSIASAWLEKFKNATKTTTAKSTGLRKHLS